MKHLRLSQAVAQALAPPGVAACPSPAPRVARNSQGGFSLVETVVTFALISLMGAGLYVVYGPGSVSSTVQVESTSLNDLRRGVDSAYRTRGSFEGISVQQGVTANWLPGRLANNGTWGTFTLAAATNKAANDSWRASYSAVPTEACERLIGHELNHWDTVLVNNVPVTTVTDAIHECDSRPTSNVAFQAYGGVRIDPDHLPDLILPPPGATAPASPIYTTPITQPPASSTPAAPPPTSTPATPPAASTPDAPGSYGGNGSSGSSPPAPTYTPCVAPPPTVSCHSCSDLGAYNGTYCTAVDATCSGPYGVVSYGNSYTQSYGCTPMCSAPPGITDTSNQSTACPAGTVTPAGATSFTQTHSRPVTYACPAGASTYTTNYGTYTPWTPDASAACAPKCAAPPATTQTQTQTASCPAGQLVSGTTNTTFTQSQTRSVSYSCPAPTGSYATNYGAYGPWSPVASAVCAPACVAPAPTSDTIYQTGYCPGGQVMANGGNAFTQAATRTVSYSCPSPTGGYATNYGAYSAWGPTAAQYGCAPICSAPGPASIYAGQQYSPTYGGSCPSGESGTYTYKYLQNVYNNYSYYCTAPNGSVGTNYNGQSTTNVQTVTVTNTCRPTCVAIDAFVLVRRQGVEQVMQAQDVREGDELCVMNPGTGAKRWGKVTYSKTTPAEAVRLRTESGITLTCSKTAPIGLADGGQILAEALLDQVIATDDAGQYGGSRVIDVREVGTIQVQHITCENDFFLAGDVEGRYVAHHNKKLGQCVAVDAFLWVQRDQIEQRLRACEIQEGDQVRVMDLRSGELTWGEVTYSRTTYADAVTLQTSHGLTLTCSTTAPIGLADGSQVLPEALEGQVIAVHDGGHYDRHVVTSVRSVGEVPVQHIDVPAGFFLVGDQDDRFAAHAG